MQNSVTIYLKQFYKIHVLIELSRYKQVTVLAGDISATF